MQINWESIQPVVVTYGLRVLAALVVLVVGIWISGRIRRFFESIMGRNQVDVTLTKFLGNIVYYTLVAAVVLAAAGELGVKTTSFMAVLGAASLAVGLALKDSLANFSSGVMLILFRPFKVGDWVQIGSESGSVQEISIFQTILHTGDNVKKIIPNGKISNDTITNVTANATRRVDLVVGIGYEDDIRKAKEVLEGIVTADSRILAEPKPVIAVSELADFSVNLVVRPWVNTSDYWSVKFDLTERIKLALDEADISIPFPQQDVHLHHVQSPQADAGGK